MKYLILSTFSLSFLMYSFTTPKSEIMGIQIKDRIYEFAEAIENSDVTKLDKLLHNDFRVVANKYPTVEKLSILTKEVYLSLIKAGKIGGTKYDVHFDYLSVEDHSATAIVKFEGEKSSMYLTLLLIERDGEWKISEDMALIK